MWVSPDRGFTYINSCALLSISQEGKLRPRGRKQSFSRVSHLGRRKVEILVGEFRSLNGSPQQSLLTWIKGKLLELFIALTHLVRN